MSPEPGEKLGLEGAKHIGQGFELLTTHQATGVTGTRDQHTFSASISGCHALDDLLCNGVIKLLSAVNQLFDVILKINIK